MKKTIKTKKLTNYYLFTIFIILFIGLAINNIAYTEAASCAGNWINPHWACSGITCQKFNTCGYNSCSSNYSCGTPVPTTTTTTTTTKPSTTTTTIGGGGSCKCVKKDGCFICLDGNNKVCDCGTCPLQWSCSEAGCYESQSGYAWKTDCEENCRFGYNCDEHDSTCAKAWLGTYKSFEECKNCCTESGCGMTYYFCSCGSTGPLCLEAKPDSDDGVYSSKADCDYNCAFNCACDPYFSDCNGDDDGEVTYQCFCDGQLTGTYTCHDCNGGTCCTECQGCDGDDNGGGCTNGATLTCTTSDNCPGTRTCTNNAWGSCVDTPNDGCPPLPCQIKSFTINEKNNSEQDPLIVWVDASLRGYFSVLNTCTKCTVSSIDTWGYPDKTYIMSNYVPEYKVSEQFKISQAGTYSYKLKCIGDPDNPDDFDEDILSLETVQAVNLPWWREIIPYLGGFLRGL